MTREVLPNGFIRLTSDNEILDKRTGRKRNMFLCYAPKERYFEETPVPEPVKTTRKRSTKK